MLRGVVRFLRRYGCSTSPSKGLGCGAFKVLEAFVLGSRNFIFYSLSVSVFGIQVGFLRSAALQALNSDGHATSTVQPGQIIELYGNTAACHMVTEFFWNSRRSEHHNHIKPCFACKVRRPTLLCTVTWWQTLQVCSMM